MNEREVEFVARQLAHADGKDWAKLPNVSTLWFVDRLTYRGRARTAVQAMNLWNIKERYDEVTR